MFYILAVLFLFLGFAMHKLKWYFLIAGYNTMSKEQKTNVDSEGLGKLMAKYSYFLALLFIILGLLTAFNLEQWNLAIIILIVVSTLWIVIRAQKYYRIEIGSDGEFQKSGGKNKVSIIITAVTLIGVAILIFFSNQPTKFDVTDQSFSISGMYGDEFQWDEIEQLQLVEELPDIALRTNGSSVGSIKKGHFKFENGKKAVLFVDSTIPLFIMFEAKGRQYYINAESVDETETLYGKLQQYQ